MANISEIQKLISELDPTQLAEFKKSFRKQRNVVPTPELDAALNTLKTEYGKLTDDAKKGVFKKHKETLGGMGLKIGKNVSAKVDPKTVDVSEIKRFLGSSGKTKKEVRERFNFHHFALDKYLEANTADFKVENDKVKKK